MTIERIDNNKIKVTVNKKDQQKYGINYESMKYSDINTRKLCEKIISEAYKEIGFTVEDSRLLVEAKKTVDGEVTIFLSKIPSSEKENEKEEYFCQTLCFSDSSALMDACNNFIPYKKKLVYSSLYEQKSKYYLYFELYSTHFLANRILRNLLEYSQRCAVPKAYIDEHYRCIAKDDALFKILK